jgi:hypothetical protein
MSSIFFFTSFLRGGPCGIRRSQLAGIKFPGITEKLLAEMKKI